MPERHAADREHDIVVFGATGFVGELTAAYLLEHAPHGTRIALAGRSRSKLEAVRERLGEAAAAVPLIVADSDDALSLRRMAESTRLVLTTVGPYARYGRLLAAVAARAGTHTCDLTGEVLYVRDLIDEVDAIARETGAKLVSACGFDSVPSDLGVLMLHRRAQADEAGTLGDTTLLVTRMKGGMSGGTIDSMRVQIDAASADPARRKVVLDPYALSPDRTGEPDLPGQRDLTSVFQEQETGRWVAPFLMAPFNTRIVRRSAALLGHAYGPTFRYREAMAFGRGARGRRGATALLLALGGLLAGMTSPARPLLDRLLPSPGEGPSAGARAAGHFRMEVRTRTTLGRRYLATVAAQGDPGYAATAVMLGESALCLALDELPDRAGVLTPAVAMGDRLIERLRAAGFTLSVEAA